MAIRIGYNERLFSGSKVRSFYHFARYHWLRAMLETYSSGTLNVIELGCFDGRAVDFMPPRLGRYVGYDANWENGLDIGRERLAGRPEVSLIQTKTPDALRQHPPKSFNAAVALETLEHIPTPLLRGYLAELARVTAGPLFVSVPNEMGAVFLAKHLVRRLAFRSGDRYRWAEIIAAALHQPHNIARREHKGFSYLLLIEELREHFDIDKVMGIPNVGLPAVLSPTVGIIAVPKAA